MSKIDLFLIVAFKEQTRKYIAFNEQLLKREAQGKKEHVSSLRRHIYVLSKFFNVHDFFQDRGKIASSKHPLIFHIPYGLENRQTGVEEALQEFKGKVPIVVRSYDAHSPVKMSREYLASNHDLILTYNQALVDNESFLFSPVVYDSFMVSTIDRNENRKKLCCMMLANKYGRAGSVKSGYEIFDHANADIENIYPMRDRMAQCSRVDVYGKGWDSKMKNYCGTPRPFDRKYAVTSRYRFSVALENCSMKTYISEKMLDCFLTLTVPVYMGAPDIKEHIPADCFVNARDFENLEDLFDFLESMSPSRYREYIDNILCEREDVFTKFSTFCNMILPIYNWYTQRVGGVCVPTGSDLQRLTDHLGGLSLAPNSGHLREALLAGIKKVLRISR